MARVPVTVSELQAADEPDDDWVLEGKELARAFWILRGLRADLKRQAEFWSSTNEAVASAYAALEQRTRELDETRRLLQESNQHLEQRVSDQVSEIVERAREIEALNSQLRAQVQERSRELALALQRLSETAPPTDVLAEGTQLGRVRILRTIGRGGCGVVYQASDQLTGNVVAVKLLRAGLTSINDLRRFLNEAIAATKVSHPGAVKTLDIDVTDDGRIYMMMELVDGVPLSQYIATGPVRPGVAARLGAAVAEVLAAAHDSGVIHRDIKPNNLHLSEREPGLRVLDFGLSKLLAHDLNDAPELTMASQFLGTPLYMSPEQVIDPTKVLPPSDCYSLGVVLYELLAGRPPFEGTVQTLSRAHCEATPPSLEDRAPAELAAIVSACLAKQPQARPTAAELARMLRGVADRAGASSTLEVTRAAVLRVRTFQTETPTLLHHS